MNDINQYIFLYSANLIFILTNLYGWILKRFYKADPYRDNYDNLFPAQRISAALYLLQIFEIPYLLMLPEPKILFYVNTFSILLFSSLMAVMQDRYFFLKRETKGALILYFLPVVLIVTYLFLSAVDVIHTTKNTYRVMFWIITIVFICYLVRLVVIKRKIRRSIRAVDEVAYSNSDDFPIRYAKRMEWIPITICILMFACFVLNDTWVKMWRDLLFTVVNVWFLLHTLNPHRKGIKPKEQLLIKESNNGSKYKLSSERCREIENRLIELIKKDRLFLDSHLTLEQLSQQLGVNRSYISETLSRSEYGSFYTLINTYRLEHAQQMLRQDPTLKLEHVAYDSGFSSMSVFSQVFKRYMKMVPSMFVKRLLTEKYTQTKQD